MTPGALWNLRLRVFARTSSLLYTVAKPVYRRYEDGTAVRVVPGVPMFPTRKAKHYWAGNEITQTAVELEPAQVRRSYAPAALAEGPLRFDAPPVAASLSFKGLASGTGAVLDSGRIPARLVERAADEYRNHLKAAWKHPTGALADVLHPCIAIRAVFGIDTIAHEPMLIDPGTMGRNRGPSVAANTTMYWRDGTRAGSTSASTPLGVPRPDGHGRACSILHFDWAVGMVPSRRGEPMHLCVERPK